MNTNLGSVRRTDFFNALNRWPSFFWPEGIDHLLLTYWSLGPGKNTWRRAWSTSWRQAARWHAIFFPGAVVNVDVILFVGRWLASHSQTCHGPGKQGFSWKDIYKSPGRAADEKIVRDFCKQGRDWRYVIGWNHVIAAAVEQTIARTHLERRSAQFIWSRVGCDKDVTKCCSNASRMHFPYYI